MERVLNAWSGFEEWLIALPYPILVPLVFLVVVPLCVLGARIITGTADVVYRRWVRMRMRAAEGRTGRNDG